MAGVPDGCGERGGFRAKRTSIISQGRVSGRMGFEQGVHAR